MIEHINGWMVTSAFVILGFIGNVLVMRAVFGLKIKQNTNDIERHVIDVGLHKVDEGAHAPVLISTKLCDGYRGDFKEDMVELKRGMNGIHRRLDTIVPQIGGD